MYVDIVMTTCMFLGFALGLGYHLYVMLRNLDVGLLKLLLVSNGIFLGFSLIVPFIIFSIFGGY